MNCFIHDHVHLTERSLHTDTPFNFVRLIDVGYDHGLGYLQTGKQAGRLQGLDIFFIDNLVSLLMDPSIVQLF